VKGSRIKTANAIRLSWKEWLVAAFVSAALIILVPAAWSALEKFEPPEDYRLQYGLSNDYWVFERWSGIAASRYPVMVVGDSVVWGQYVKREDTLSQCLNKLENSGVFANMGVDGIHPAAMAGLMKYYGKEICDKSVILHLNPLWMTSRDRDLQGAEERRFNHPRLVPQFLSRPACYRAPFATRIGVLFERAVPFFSLAHHIKTACLENMTLSQWTVEHPYRNPLGVIGMEIRVPASVPQSNPVPWTESRIEQQDFPWVKLDQSYQWRSYMEVIKLLKQRGNRILVIIGPFNTHLLTAGGLERYHILKAGLIDWLTKNKIDYYVAPVLPSEYYGDASHPLREGYRELALGLHESAVFRNFMNR